ncbi:MAG: polyphosphate kinase 1 [Opitutaceae bacterium]
MAGRSRSHLAANSAGRSPRRAPAHPVPAAPPVNRGGAPAAFKAAYFNRELSWLAFDRRVLEQAQNRRHPLLERVRFLSIVSSNLDEFFEIRVAGLMQQMDSGVTEPGPDGLSPREQLRRIHSVVASLIDDQYRCWREDLVPALGRKDIRFRSADNLTRWERTWVRSYFREQVYPVLTPLALDQAHPFPQLGNKTLNVVVAVEPVAGESRRAPPAGGARLSGSGGLAILPVPRILPRLVAIGLPARRRPPRYIFLSDIIKLCAGELFPGCRLKSAHAFRVTRNSDLYIDDEEAENLLKTIEEELRNLRRGAAVRLEIEDGVPEAVFSTLCNYLDLPHEYVFRLKGPINLLRLQSLADLDRPDLKFPPFEPVVPAPLRGSPNLFDQIRARDILLHHPYDSFAPVVDFIEQAARDPEVFAIKQTLYRTSGDSPVVRALIDASRNGKQVTALVELKARFDEANNIQWAKQLEEAGVHVLYGFVGHKTHCKLCLVVRREGARMRHYAHLGTGNYNQKTARLYTDISLFTARTSLTRGIARTFNTLTGLGRSPSFRHLLVAPFNLQRRVLELIGREAANARAGRPARIVAKMNALVDKGVIDALYAASQAGVRIDLIVRGICCLVPGMPGLSERIRVRSLVGRFLEHARVYCFHNDGGEPLVYSGSADWMPRNFFRRVEAVFPVAEPAMRRRILEDILPAELKDNVDAQELRGNGAYVPVGRAKGARSFSAHEHFMAEASQRAQ